MERWQNKIAVVTGASCGIGAAVCKDLVAKGMIVVGFARRLERMQDELKPSLPADQQDRFHAVRCDVTKEDDIKKAFQWVEEKFGGVDVLVNNAGMLKFTHILAADNSQILRDTLDTNVLGVALCTRESFRSMKKRGGDGHVVIVNSVLGHVVPPTSNNISLNMYPPSKFALTAMTEVLRREFQMNDTRIKVTSISPGFVNTEIVGSMPSGVPTLDAKDVSDAIVYCIQTPPNVQIHELTIKPMGEPL